MARKVTTLYRCNELALQYGDGNDVTINPRHDRILC